MIGTLRIPRGLGDFVDGETVNILDPRLRALIGGERFDRIMAYHLIGMPHPDDESAWAEIRRRNRRFLRRRIRRHEVPSPGGEQRARHRRRRQQRVDALDLAIFGQVTRKIPRAVR